MLAGSGLTWCGIWKWLQVSLRRVVAHFTRSYTKAHGAYAETLAYPHANLPSGGIFEAASP